MTDQRTADGTLASATTRATVSTGVERAVDSVKNKKFHFDLTSQFFE